MTQTQCTLLVPPLWGSINIPITINPGLAPWAMQEYRPYRALFNRYMFADAFLRVYSATASAVGTTLLHSPGWNEGKARNETLGTHRQK